MNDIFDVDKGITAIKEFLFVGSACGCGVILGLLVYHLLKYFHLMGVQ